MLFPSPFILLKKFLTELSFLSNNSPSLFWSYVTLLLSLAFFSVIRFSFYYVTVLLSKLLYSHSLFQIFGSSLLSFFLSPLLSSKIALKRLKTAFWATSWHLLRRIVMQVFWLVYMKTLSFKKRMPFSLFFM